MAVKWPSEALGEVKNLRSAQSLYSRLGRYLSGRYQKGGPLERAVTRKEWRREAREVRRQLEEQWGNAVRLTSTSRYATGVGGTGAGGGRKKASVTMPTWSMRGHFTVQKPPPKQLASPMLYIPLDGLTSEPIGVFYDTLEPPRMGLTDALAALQSAEERARRILPSVSLSSARAAALDVQVAQLDKLIKQLEARRRRLKREVDAMREQNRTAGGPMGAGADVWEK